MLFCFQLLEFILSLFFCQPPSCISIHHPLLIPCVVQRLGKLVHVVSALPYLLPTFWLHLDLTSNSEHPEQLSFQMSDGFSMLLSALPSTEELN